MESYNKETGHAILEAARLDVLLSSFRTCLTTALLAPSQQRSIYLLC